MVFLLGAAISIATGTVFVIFGSTKVQPWNSPSDKKKLIDEDGAEEEEEAATYQDKGVVRV